MSPPSRPFAFPPHGKTSLLATSLTLRSLFASLKIYKFSASAPTKPRWSPSPSRFREPSKSCDSAPFQFIARTTKVGLSFPIPIIFPSALTLLDLTGVPDFVSRLTSLETLIMDKIHVSRPGDGPAEPLSWIPLVLRSVTAPIRRLCIELMISNTDHLDSIDWSQIDHILTNRETLRCLTEVSFTVISTSTIRGTIDTEALKAFVARRLPLTSQRGILRRTVGKA